MVDDVERKVEGAQAPEPEPAPEAAAQAAEPSLEQQLAEAKAQAAEYLDQWRRTAADLSNYRKRTEREREEITRFSNAALLTRLLPVIDDFDRAMAALPPDLRQLTWVEGVALIDRKLRLILEAEGLRPVETVGKPFDPEKHEAVIREETDAYPDGQILAELQKGYELNGRVLRHALVKVAVAKARETGTEATGEPGATGEAGEAGAAGAA
jgi:molecular chaperone GrpE